MDFNWTRDKDKDHYVCEVEGAILLAYDKAIDGNFRWYVAKDYYSPSLRRGTTSISIDYAQGKAEGAYMGLKATGQI